jgi:DNA polymerase-3 subunit delta
MTPEVKEFLKYLKKPVETTILMIDATNINIQANNEIYKALKNFAMIINYSESEEIEVRGWVVRTLATNNIEIKDDALVLFMEYLNNDQIRMGTELNKLIAYLGDGGVVTTEIIKEMISKDPSKLIYSLVNAIVTQDNNAINNIYQELSSNTKDITGIISIVTNTFKELFTTLKLLQNGYTQSDIAKFYGISTNFAYYKVKDAKTFKISDLEKQVKKLAELDYLIKSGQIDKNLGFELFLIK